MITYINSIIDGFIKYTKINNNIQKKITIIDEKLTTIKKYEGIYDLGLSHTNLSFKKVMLNNLLHYRLMNLKSCLTKFYSDNYGVYKDLNELQKSLSSVLKEKNDFVPRIPRIILSEKNNKLDISDFKKWVQQLQTVLHNTKRRINLLNEKRDAFETMIENELPAIDLHKTMNLQKDDLLNEYERIKHRFVSIINFSYYITKRILKYKEHNWDINPEEKHRDVRDMRGVKESPTKRGARNSLNTKYQLKPNQGFRTPTRLSYVPEERPVGDGQEIAYVVNPQNTENTENTEIIENDIISLSNDSENDNEDVFRDNRDNNRDDDKN
jgi:hypothetical protein